MLGWDLSVFVSIYKKGCVQLSANYRRLRLIQALKKIFGIALNDTLRLAIVSELVKFGFQVGTSSLEALVLAIAHTQLQGTISILVDQKGAYDTVNRENLMQLIDQ